MEILDFIIKDGLVMIPALFLLGEIIKKTEVFEDNWIPLIILVVSLGLTPMLLGGFNAENIVQAILVAGMPTYGYEFIKQLMKPTELSK